MSLTTEAMVITPGYDEKLAQQTRERLGQTFPEAELYINQFLEFTGALVLPDPQFEPVIFQPSKFAVIKASGSIAKNRKQLDGFADDVADLSRLGLPVTIVHGAGDQITHKLSEAGVASQRHADGTRITPAKDMWAVEDALRDVGITIEDALTERGVDVARFSGIFTASLSDPEDLGSVASITDIDAESVKRVTRAGKVVVASSLARQELLAGRTRFVNSNADITWTAMAEALRPIKAISMTKLPGIIDTETGDVISELTADEALQRIDAGEITDGAVIKVRKAIELVQSGVIRDVVIINSLKLAEELYTPRGSGTDIGTNIVA